jgi:hypothetical protein
VAKILVVVRILLFIALHPVHGGLRMAFAVAEKDVATGKSWTLAHEVFNGASHLREKCFLHVGHSYGRSRVSEKVVSLMKNWRY